MTVQIIAHKTSDGKVFEDEAQAEAHESRLIAMKELVPLLSCTDCPLVLSSFDVSDMVEYMVDNRAVFIRALQGQEASEEDEGTDLVEDEDGAPLPPEQQPATPLLDVLDMPVVVPPSESDALADSPRADDDTPF